MQTRFLQRGHHPAASLKWGRPKKGVSVRGRKKKSSSTLRQELSMVPEKFLPKQINLQLINIINN